jgi:DNA-binding NarL/FixJ family response regulator
MTCAGVVIHSSPAGGSVARGSVMELLADADAVVAAAALEGRKPRQRDAAASIQLNPREAEVLHLLPEGKTDRAIGT